MMFACTFILGLLWVSTTSVEVEVFTGIELDSSWFYCPDDSCSSVSDLMSCQISMNVTVDNNNQTFPNKVTFTTFICDFVVNNTVSPVFPFYYYYYPCLGCSAAYMIWNESTNFCTFNIPNGEGRFVLPVSINSNIFFTEFPNTYISNGEIFINYGWDVDGPYTCFQYGGEQPWGDGKIWHADDICFFYYRNVTISNTASDICQAFHSSTTVTDNEDNTSIATLEAIYVTASSGYKWQGLNVSVISFNSSIADLTYHFANDVLNCRGNITNSNSNCYISFPSTDTHFVFLVNLENNFTGDAFYINTGSLFFRNGTFLKQNYSLFTKEDPCSIENGPVFYGKGASMKTKFCCTEFATTESTTFPPSSTLPPKGTCLKYKSKTFVSDNSTSLEVDYKLNSTGFMLNFVKYVSKTNSTVQVEAYSADLFSQTCSASTTAYKECFFVLSTTGKYELQMRTSSFPDGFNMLQVIEQNAQFISPELTMTNPCVTSTNPYNYGSSNITATTSFCCDSFA